MSINKELKFTDIFYEPSIVNYTTGRMLLDKYSGISKHEIASHNNIYELRTRANKDFSIMKKFLVLGVRKTLRHIPNNKTSDFIVPFTSSGCYASCLYCYLVCNYNKCSYLRIFVNREDIVDKLINASNKSEKELVFEIGSNSDLILENLVTGNLVWAINEFISKTKKGKLTFPTKFSYVDEILKLEHDNRIVPRMSVNPQEIITKIELRN